jgi:hypothetical protein
MPRRLVIDLHLHVLPGVDDGPRTLGESVALARVSAAATFASRRRRHTSARTTHDGWKEAWLGFGRCSPTPRSG